MKAFTTGAALIAAIVSVPAGADAPDLRVDRAVLLMRHGVRPPTKAQPMPAGSARDPWPDWPVAPGYLTPHGAAAIERLGAWDRAQWIRAGLLPRRGCAAIRIVADSDQRTIATAERWAAAVAPGCTVPIAYKPQDVADPIFSPIDEQAVAFDPAAGRRAVLADAGPGGIEAAAAALRPELARVDAILCARPAVACGIAREPTALAPSTPGKRPKLTGALDRGSTAAQILLLQYAEGKPMAQVGWGRATAGDIARLSALHAAEFRLLARPAYVARANLALIAPLLADALTRADAPAVTMVSGHDTNVVSLGGLLDLHWHVPGLAEDDPSPGGAILLERLTDRAGRHFVRASYRSQTLEQIRRLTPLDRQAPYRAVLTIRGCPARADRLCPLEDFTRSLAVR